MRKSKSPLPGLAALVCAAALLFFTIPGQAQQALQALHNHVRPVVASGQAAPVGFLPPNQRMSLAITLPLRNQSELTSLLDRLYDPSSPDYRHYLTVAQFTEQFGPTVQDYQAVVNFAKANGFTVTDTPPNRLLVDINGTVAQIDKAFHVVMTVYQHPTENRTFYSPDREPSLDLSVPVAHIAGLNNYSIPRPKLKRAPVGQAIQSHAGSGPGGAYLGSDMRAAYYGSTALTGSGQSVGLLEFDGYDMSDVTATFDGQSNNVAITNVLVDGGQAGSDGDDSEQVLDIVQAASMAPGLTSVRVYIAPISSAVGVGDVDIFNKMATDNISKQLSCSWGWNPEDTSSDDPIFQEFAVQGQTLFVASGDDGAYTGNNVEDGYIYPADDAYVMAVGATDLTTNGAGGAWESETAWLYSGGGPSDNGIAIPSWQVGVANSSNGGSTTLRNVPDVAAEGNYDNYLCYQGTCVEDEGGTSFAAPRWAGFLALINQQGVANGNSTVGFINPAIYAIGKGSSYDSDFHDITSGNNDCCGQAIYYNAVTGYDLVTGWGSPNGQNLINALGTPGIYSPTNNSTLTSNAATFSWLGHSGATAYWLDLGATQGGNTYLDSGSLSSSTLSYSVTSLPTNGSSVWARWYYFISGAWQHIDYSYTAYGGVPSGDSLAAMTSPAPSSTLTGSSVTFSWSAGVGPSAYWLDIGNVAGGNQYYQSKSMTALTATVNSLPTNGSSVYVTLYSLIGSLWFSNAYTYTAFNPLSGAAMMKSPTPGSTLTANSVTFTWSAGSGASAYWLDIGTSPGGNTIYQSGNLGNVLTTTAPNVQPNGSTVYVTLYSYVGGTWVSNAYTYTAAPGAVMQSPTPGSPLSGTSVAFTWSAGSGTPYQLTVGSTYGGSDIYQSGSITALTAKATNLPANSTTVYVTLYTYYGGQWVQNYYSYVSGP